MTKKNTKCSEVCERGRADLAKNIAALADEVDRLKSRQECAINGHEWLSSFDADSREVRRSRRTHFLVDDNDAKVTGIRISRECSRCNSLERKSFDITSRRGRIELRNFLAGK
jgi:hypothetical protein